jgi:hypothetical protein
MHICVCIARAFEFARVHHVRLLSGLRMDLHVCSHLYACLKRTSTSVLVKYASRLLQAWTGDRCSSHASEAILSVGTAKDGQPGNRTHGKACEACRSFTAVSRGVGQCLANVWPVFGLCLVYVCVCLIYAWRMFALCFKEPTEYLYCLIVAGEPLYLCTRL